MTKLDYYDGKNLMKDGQFRISPSSIGKFFNNPSEWYRDYFLGESSFTGSTASVLGTCVHYVAEQYAKNKDISDEDKEEIDKYIKQESMKHSEIDPYIVRAQWKIMGSALINQYLKDNIPTNVEDFMLTDLGDNVLLGGSCDYFNAKGGGLVLDWKTTSQKSPPTTIPWGYKVQAMAYAYMYRSKGFDVDRYAIAYITRDEVGRVSEKTGKPLKDYPSTVNVVTECITDEDWSDFEDTINLMKETILAAEKHPELVHVIYKSMKLKGK